MTKLEEVALAALAFADADADSELSDEEYDKAMQKLCEAALAYADEVQEYAWAKAYPNGEATIVFTEDGDAVLVPPEGETLFGGQKKPGQGLN